MNGTLFSADVTGSTPADRAEEAGRILKMVEGREFAMSEADERMVIQTRERYQKFGLKTVVTPKQLFYLRDIKDRYL